MEDCKSSKDQSADNSMPSKGQVQEVSAGNKDSIGIWFQRYVCFAMTEILYILRPWSETLQKTEIKCGRVINLVEEISRQPNIRAAAWGFFSQNYTENWEQTAHYKSFPFCQKESSYKDITEENLIAAWN